MSAVSTTTTDQSDYQDFCNEKVDRKQQQEGTLTFGLSSASVGTEAYSPALILIVSQYNTVNHY